MLMYERVDVVDETILLAMKDGRKSLGDLSILTGLNYHTCRQRLNKLLKYHYIAKPKYGEYALSEKGRRFVDNLTLPVATDLKDSNLNKLIYLLPTELHRSFFRLLLSGIIGKHFLRGVYDDGYPAFILGGETKGFKTALATVMCKLLGLKPEENIYLLFSAIAGEFGVRRFRDKGNKYSIVTSPLFKQPFICLDEYDKVTERDTKRNVLFFMDGRHQFLAEGEQVENWACTMITLNTKIGKEGITKFGIPEPYIRRSIVADTEHVRMELKDIDLVAKKIFEMKDFPRINLERLRLDNTKLSNDIFSCVRNLLLSCTDESFRELVDTRPLVILALGRSTLLNGDIREASYQTIWDRLVCLESIGGTVKRWRECVANEWTKYKREKMPEITSQMNEAKQRDDERKKALKERAAVIKEKNIEKINNQTTFIHHRAELCSQIKGLIKELGPGEPLAEPLRWLRKNIDSSRTPEVLNQYEESFMKSMLPKVKSRLQEKKNAQDQAKREKEATKLARVISKELERKKGFQRKEEKRKESDRRKSEIRKLREYLNQINYYIRRKDLKEGEDLVLILQELRIIQPVEGSMFLRISDKPVKGQWIRNINTGIPVYFPPNHNFVDYGATIDRYTKEVTGGRLYKWFEDVRNWTSWESVRPLLFTKRQQILEDIDRRKVVVPSE